jgi:serine/threonine protein kinase
MGTHKRRDPFRYYEVLKIMGDGSMGSVSKVRKRKSAVGGSARKAYVKQEKRNGILHFMPCLSFCYPKGSGEEPTKAGALTVPGGKDENGDPPNSTITTKDSDSVGAISAVTYDEVTSSSSTGGSAIESRTPSKSNKNNNNHVRHSSLVSFRNGEYGVVYALKSIVMDRVMDATFIKELQNEIAILKTLDHPNICKAIETYEYRDRMYLVLELCSGGGSVR